MAVGEGTGGSVAGGAEAVGGAEREGEGAAAGVGRLSYGGEGWEAAAASVRETTAKLPARVRKKAHKANAPRHLGAYERYV